MKPETVKLFSECYDEGYDVQQDELYMVWSKMKALTIAENLTNDSVETSSSSANPQEHEKGPVDVPLPKLQQHISPVLDDVLKYPNPHCKT